MSRDLKEGREGAMQIPEERHSAEGRASAKALNKACLGAKSKARRALWWEWSWRGVQSGRRRVRKA